MARTSTKIKLYLEANSKTYANEKSNIEVRDDMIDGVSSPYIHTWNVSGLAKNVNNNVAGNTRETNEAVLFKRKAEYLSWQEQLDKLYHDINDGKLDTNGTWYKHIKAVKDANPKG